MYSFFGIKPTSIVWSVHSAFQHSDESGGVSPIVREETPEPLIRFGFFFSFEPFCTPVRAQHNSESDCLLIYNLE